MIKYLFSIFAYFYICFKKGIRCDFPCRVNPYFLINGLKGLHEVYLGSAYIGKEVQISSGCCFYDTPQLFGKVRIEKNTSICGPATRIFSKINEIHIGSFCSIASNVIIQEYNHKVDTITTYDILSHICHEDDIKNTTTSKGPIIIEDGVWIGSNSVILSGVKIGRGAIIGAGSVVLKDIPAYAIAAGNPAKVIKYRFSEVSIRMIEESQWWKWDDEKIIAHKDLFRKVFK